MKKKRIPAKQLEKLLTDHDLQKYDVCKICGVSAVTVDRWIKGGIPEPEYRLISLSLGDM